MAFMVGVVAIVHSILEVLLHHNLSPALSMNIIHFFQHLDAQHSHVHVLD